ncbi:MAG: hypothetical protein R3324_13990 [Halobacteriales archaeon]|nr:hypothetical protein [Halobacteriales archaeon]
MAKQQARHSATSDAAFRTVTLDRTADEALERVNRHLKGLTATATGAGYKIRDQNGLVVAVLSEYDRGADEVGVRLRYRIGPSPSMVSVRRGRRVYEILEPHIW